MKITEEEIRPEKIFDEYLALTAKDTIDFFSDADTVDISCPACSTKGKFWVKKSLFTYELCPSCQTIFVNPRPVIEAFNSYYTDSPSTKFWATTFYKETETARREKLWKPKALMVKDRILKYQQDQKIEYLIDIGGGYGIFDEEITNIMSIEPIVVEPSVHLAEICRKKGLKVIEKFMEDILPSELPDGRKCYVSFELFEHLHDPKMFLTTVYHTMGVGDILIFTTLSGVGIDIQLLRENSKSLSPPHHLNFLNPKSVSKLLNITGFEVLEAITPGKLDVDILKKNKNFITDPFFKSIFNYLNEVELASLQNFISSTGLSSHMMITCIKK